MLTHRAGKLGASFLEQLSPLVRIKLFCLEHGDKVLVAKL